jgi:hypothetical protein
MSQGWPISDAPTTLTRKGGLASSRHGKVISGPDWTLKWTSRLRRYHFFNELVPGVLLLRAALFLAGTVRSEVMSLAQAYEEAVV